MWKSKMLSESSFQTLALVKEAEFVFASPIIIQVKYVFNVY